MPYCIKAGYVPRLANEFCDQRCHDDLYQREVYEYAARLPRVESVLDVGTGGGFKLLKHFRRVYTRGLDLEPNVSWLRQQYPDRDWEEADLKTAAYPGYDLLIAADIIEHLPDPDVLLEFIVRCAPRLAVISTPDRDRLQEEFWNGPPKNQAHCWEWSSAEFAAYIGRRFDVLDHVLPLPGDHSTQFVLARMKT